MSRKDTLKAINALPHIRATYNMDWEQYRIAPTGKGKAAEERAAAYADDSEDAMGTACAMSAHYAAGGR